MFVCISVQHTNGMAAIRLRTRATLTNKWIARRTRFSAHSDHKHVKDLHARPDQDHPDSRATLREAVEMNASVTVIGEKRRLPPGRRVAGWGWSGGKGCLPRGRRVAGWGGPGGRAACPSAAGWRIGGGQVARAASPRYLKPRHNHLSS